MASALRLRQHSGGTTPWIAATRTDRVELVVTAAALALGSWALHAALVNIAVSTTPRVRKSSPV